MKPELKFILENIIDTNENIRKQYHVLEDRDNFDYILSVDELVDLKGKKYRAKKNFINRFIKNYPNHQIIDINLSSQNEQDKIIELFHVWQRQKNKSHQEISIEIAALKILLRDSREFNLHGIGILVNTELVAFSIDELLSDSYAIIHFEKANMEYIGIFQYLKYLSAKYLKKNEYKYINYEQDLGIEGLRKAKESYNPIKYLKKYKISNKQ